MKKLIVLAAAALVAGIAYAQTTVTNRGEVITVHTGNPTPVSTQTNVSNTETIYNVVVQNSATVAGAPVVTTATIARVDTNVTTTATAYTPAFIGQILLGGAGAGTNAAWIAKGVTTNDWVKVQ